MELTQVPDLHSLTAQPPRPPRRSSSDHTDPRCAPGCFPTAWETSWVCLQPVFQPDSPSPIWATPRSLVHLLSPFTSSFSSTASNRRRPGPLADPPRRHSHALRCPIVETSLLSYWTRLVGVPTCLGGGPAGHRVGASWRAVPQRSRFWYIRRCWPGCPGKHGH